MRQHSGSFNNRLLRSRSSNEESYNSLSPELMTIYSPHSPVKPSPLRQNIRFDDTKYDSSYNTDDDHSIISSSSNVDANYNSVSARLNAEMNHMLAQSQNHLLLEQLRYKASKTIATLCLLLERTIIFCGKKCNVSFIKTVSMASVSPTTLGVITASRLYDLRLLPCGTRKQKLESTNALNTSQKDAVDAEWSRPPIINDDSIEYSQIFMKNHILYQSEYHEKINYEITKDFYQLPNVSSKYSQPNYSLTYDLLTYSQNIFQTGIILASITAVALFIKILLQDIEFSIAKTKSILEPKAIECFNAYVQNNCGSGKIRSDMVKDHCLKWKCCMNKNRDIFHIYKESITWGLVYNSLRSLIEPNGWSNAVLITIGLTIWIFSSNFLLGFLRALAYYGIGHSNLISLSTKKLN